MARLDTASAVRAPSGLRHRPEGRGGEAGDGDDGRPRLRLVVTRGKLGVELERPFAMGPLTVRAMALSLPDVRFPVDLSGGVAAFRNRRGHLDLLEVVLEARHEGWSTGLRDFFGGDRPDILLAPTSEGWLVGARAGARVLAFDVAVAPAGEDVRLVPLEARGLGLGAPPHAAALVMLSGLVGAYGKRVGGVVLLERPARALVGELLSRVGMRSPSTAGLAWSPPGVEVGVSTLLASREPGAPTSPRVLRAIECSALAASGDEALARGRLDEARSLYLDALERAPRHPELSRRIAELDRAAGRPEVALGVLADLGGAADAELLQGELFLAVGDRASAQAAFERAAESEPYGSLAAAAWERVAAAAGGRVRLDALDRAVSRAPTWTELRWRRFEARLEGGELRLALADAGELEAAARGSDRRFEACERVARTLLRDRHLDAAKAWFERALRYRPDRSDALAGLAAALDALGQGRRALELLHRAVASDRRRRSSDRRPDPVVVIALARALVDVADDRPAAVAHVRSIPASQEASFEARLLEGRWRAELGDTAAASEAFARLGDEVERSLGALVGGEAPRGDRDEERSGLRRRDLAHAVASYLEEAARFEEEVRRDRSAARRLLEFALRLAPRAPGVRAAFRRTSASLDAAPAGEVTGGLSSRGSLFATPEGSDESRKGPTASGVRAFGAIGNARPARAEATSPGATDPRVSPRAGQEGADSDSGPLHGSGGLGSHDVDVARSRERAPSTSTWDAADDEARAERLSDRLRADPGDESVVFELADVLERLDRDHDLLALLSARIEEEGEPLRARLVTRRRRVLERMRDAARAAGQESEAQLYELLLQRD